jgi:hypothetical protein
MREPSIASRLKSALQQHFDSIVREPLPDKLAELIEKLREHERKQAQSKARSKDRREPQ